MADNAKIVLDVGMDRKDFFNGAKDIQNAIRSLQTSVVSMGREIRTAAGGYGTAMLQSAKASRDFEGSVQGIRDKMQELQNSITAIKAAADRFNGLKQSIDNAKNALNDLLDKQYQMSKDGGHAPSDAFNSVQENIEQTKEKLGELNRKWKEYRDTVQYARERLQTGTDENGVNLSDAQKSQYSDEIKYSAEKANEITLQYREAKNALASFERQREELINRGEGPSEEWVQVNQQIDQATARITDMKTELKEMQKNGYENADQSDEYKDQVQRLKELITLLGEVIEKKKETFESPVLTTWKNMTSLSKIVTEGFGRIQYAAGLAGQAIQHPIQAADRALGTLIVSVGRAASSLARMAGNAALSFLRNIATTAQNAAIQLARLVSNAVTSGLGRLASAAKNAVVQLGKLAGSAIQSGISKLGSAIGQVAKKLLGLDKSARRANKGLGASLKTVLKYAFGVRSMFFLFRRIRQAFMAGIKDIAKQNPELQASLNSLSKSFSALKGSIAAAFAPIVTVVAPALTMLMNLLAGAMNSVGAFFAALTGKKTYQTSVGKVGTDAKKSSKDVKELNRQLASFDHLNILTDKDKDNKDNTKDSGLEYKTVPIPKAIQDFVDQLNELWNAEDFEGIGALFAEKINGIFEKIDKAISWDNVGAKIEKAVNAITGIINGLIYNIDWSLIGKTIGDGINTLIRTFNLFVTGINWVALGKGIADGLNSLISTVNWDELGQALANRVNIVIWTLYGVISNFDFSAAGTAFAEMVTNIFSYVDWNLLAQMLYKLFGGALDFIYEAVRNIEWGKIISKFVSGFNTFVKGMADKLKEFIPKADELGTIFGNAIADMFKIDWPELGRMLSIGFNVAIAFLKSAVLRLKDEAPTIGRNISDAINAFVEEAHIADIGETINGLFVGAIDLAQALFEEFEKNNTAVKLGEQISAMLSSIEFGKIATGVWNVIKSAFAAAGSFVDALFSEPIDYSRAEIDGAYLAKAMDFNAKPLGERMALKIKGVFEAIPWKDIAETTWKGIQEAFKVAGDFVATLLGAEDASPEAIGKAVGDKLGQIPWGSIFKNMINTIMGFLNPAIKELLGSGNGRVFIAVSGALLALRVGLGKALMTGMTALGSTLMSSAGLLIADIILIKHDIEGIMEIIEGSADVAQANADSVKNTLETYTRILEEDGEEAANTFAELAGGIQTSGKTTQEVLAELYTAVTEQTVDKQPWWVTTGQDLKDGIDNIIGIFTGKEPEVDKAAKMYQDAMESRFVEGAIIDNVTESGKNIASSTSEGYIGETEVQKPNIVDALAKMFGANPDAEQIATSIKTSLGPAFEQIGAYCTTEAAYSGQGFYQGLRIALLDENNKIKSDELRSQLAAMLSPAEIEAFERGDMTVDEFFSALGNGGLDASGNASATLLELVNTVLNGPVGDAQTSGEKVADTYVTALGDESLARKGEAVDKVQTLFNEAFNYDDADADGKEVAIQYLDAFNEMAHTKSGEIKPEFVGVIEAMFGSIEAYNDGMLPAREFMSGLSTGFLNAEGSTRSNMLSVFERMVTAVKNDDNGFDTQNAEQQSSDFLEGFAQGAEGNETRIKDRVTKVFQTISDAVSNVVSGVKNFFSKLLGGGDKDADTGVSADDIAKPYEDGSKRAETALNDLKASTNKSLTDIGTDFQKLGEDATKAFDDIDQTSKDDLGNVDKEVTTKLNNIKKTFDTAFTTIKNNLTQKYTEIKTSTQLFTTQIKTSISTMLTQVKNTIVNPALSGLKNDITNQMESIQAKLRETFEDINNTSVSKAELMKARVTDAVNMMKSNMVSDVEIIKNQAVNSFERIIDIINGFGDSADRSKYIFESAQQSIVYGLEAIKQHAGEMGTVSWNMYNALEDAYNNMRNIDFSGIGVSIINGIIRGINEGWPWLRDTAQAVARAALDAAKASLGIHSPSRAFRDEVGKNMIAGMSEGLKDAEPNMLKTIDGIAQNATDEMANSKIAANVGVGENGLVNGLDEVLSAFSNKVTDSFSSMIEKMNAISESVTFRAPNIAAGTVLPYSVSGNSTDDSRAAVEAQKASNEDLISSMIQLVNNQTSALVQAIQRYGGTTVNLDVHSLTDAIVSEINRRTRSSGKSPLLT